VAKTANPRGGRAVIQGGIAGALVAATVAGLVLPRLLGTRTEPTQATAPRDPVPAASGMAGLHAQDPPAAATLAAPTPSASAVTEPARIEAEAAAPPVVASASPVESAASAASHALHKDRPKAAPGALGVPPTAADAKAAPQPSASGRGAIDKVEGREIRNGL
jgi:hypothetical protein